MLWHGRRGFHALFHSAPALTHAWSEDGIHWRWTGSLTGPKVKHGGGDHQRPRVTLTKDGDIEAIFATTEVDPSVSDASHLVVFRANKPKAKTQEQEQEQKPAVIV